MQLANRTRTVWGPRQRALVKARARFNASLQRPGGRVVTQCRRCLIAHSGVVRMKDLRAWAYAGQPRQHWQYSRIYSALRRLGAQRTGWGMYVSSAVGTPR